MTTYDLVDKLTLLSPIGLLIGLIAGLYFYASLNVVHRIITFYLALAFGIDLISRGFSYYGEVNLVLMPIFNLIELLIFGLVYLHFFRFQKKYLIGGILICFLAPFAYDVYSVIKFKEEITNSYSSLFGALGILILAFLFFFERIKAYTEMNWSVFRLNSAILIYFSVKLVFYIPFDFFIHVHADFKFYFWLLHLVLLICFYLFLARSIWNNGNVQKQ